MERLGINAVMNSGAIELNGKYYLVARIEGNDRKSFFGVAESDNGIDGFRFWDYPILLPDTCPEETNVYDMRLTKHEDGYIYGVFCSESKDTSVSDLSAAVAAAGIVRTKDLKTWERLPNLVTLRSPQQRNVVLHPEFVDGKYAFYTRPMDDFIETGSGGGIGFGLCEDITHAVIDEEKMTSLRKYHTITEAKNGAGATPIKTEKGWIHIAHGVRNTAAGLRYVIYGVWQRTFKRSVESDCRAVRASDRTERRGARRGCQQWWYSPTERSSMRKTRCLFTTHPRIHGCMWRPRRWRSWWTMYSIRRPIREDRWSVWHSGAVSSRRILHF